MTANKITAEPKFLDCSEEMVHFMEKIKKLKMVADAARDLLSEIYHSETPESIKGLIFYDEIEDLELALNALHD